MDEPKIETVVRINVAKEDNNETTARQGCDLAGQADCVVEWRLAEREDSNFDRRLWHEKLSTMIRLLFGFSSPENPVIVDIRMHEGDYIARLHV